jgi:glycosyltransferase involved in cell wall biosynthesis
VLVIDNHSQDNTDEVVGRFGDPRIRLLKIHNHGVIASSRNLGMNEARGEWIAFLDSDDFWYPAKLEHCLKRLNQGYDLVCHGERWFGDKRDRQVFYGPESRASYQSLLYEGNCISTSAVVVSRIHVESVGGFREDADIITAEDYDLWLRLVHQGTRIGFVPEILGEYSIHEGNQSRAVVRNMLAVMQVVKWHLSQDVDPEIGLRMRARRRKAIVYYGGARGLQDTDQYREAWPYFFRAMLTWPFVPKFYAAMLFNALHRRVG